MGVQHLSGANFSGYQLHESLGFSSHTAVYRASSSRSGKWAVKVVDGDLEPEAGLADRLRRDADLLSRTDHPEILPIYDVARYDTLTFAASPLLAAPTLRDLLEQGPLEDDTAWGVLCQLADTLDRLHAWGLSHRGVKPVNILIDEGGRIRLVEFGISSRWTRLRVNGRHGRCARHCMRRPPPRAPTDPSSLPVSMWSSAVRWPRIRSTGIGRPRS